jgi:hypothetical protein
MPRDLGALLKAVQDDKSFIEFVDALASNFEEEREVELATPASPYSPGTLGWENETVGTFLGAAAAWGFSTALNPKNNTAAQNPWSRCAHILYAGKFYE